MTIAWALLIALIAGIAAASATAIAWRGRFPPLPPWTWRNIFGLIAILATIGGAAVLTAAAWWLLDEMLLMGKALIAELMRDPKARPEVGQVLVTIVDAVAWGLKLLLAGVLVVLLSLGMAVTPRRIKVDRTGAEMSGGADDAPSAAQTVAAAAQTKADEITENKDV